MADGRGAGIFAPRACSEVAAPTAGVASTAPLASAWRAWAAPMLVGTTYCYVTSLPVMLAVVFAARFIDACPAYAFLRSADFMENFAVWDGEWYARIAADGYFYDPERKSSVAFFPAYPRLAGTAGSITILCSERIRTLVGLDIHRLLKNCLLCTPCLSCSGLAAFYPCRILGHHKLVARSEPSAGKVHAITEYFHRPTFGANAARTFVTGRHRPVRARLAASYLNRCTAPVKEKGLHCSPIGECERGEPPVPRTTIGQADWPGVTR